MFFKKKYDSCYLKLFQHCYLGTCVLWTLFYSKRQRWREWLIEGTGDYVHADGDDGAADDRVGHVQASGPINSAIIWGGKLHTVRYLSYFCN